MKRLLFIAAIILSFSPFGVSAASADKFYIVCVPIVEEHEAYINLSLAVNSRTFAIYADKKSSVEIFTDGDKVEYRKWDITEFQDEFFVLVNNKEKPTHKITFNRLSGYAQSYSVPKTTVKSPPPPEGFVKVLRFEFIGGLRCRKAKPIF